jgi:hypothetical protein
MYFKDFLKFVCRICVRALRKFPPPEGSLGLGFVFQLFSSEKLTIVQHPLKHKDLKRNKFGILGISLLNFITFTL